MMLAEYPELSMPGLVGGMVADQNVDEMTDRLHHEPWYGSDTFGTDSYSIGFVHHNERDPAGWTVWNGSRCAGVIHGTISQSEAPHNPDPATIIPAILDDPQDTLASLNGSFVVACVDTAADRIVVGTDKLGTRACYYQLDGQFLFGSQVGALLTQINDPQINVQAVSDLLLLGHLWGTKTLIDGVHALPPATVLEHDAEDGSVTLDQYWWPDFTPAPVGSSQDTGYARELFRRYRQAIREMTTTIDGTAGLWLSGGLDSRAMAAELGRCSAADESDTLESLNGYTYDLNPKGGGNPEIARQVGECLNIPVEEVGVTPDQFLRVVDTAIDVTDGMLRWPSFVNISSVFDIPTELPTVLLEGAAQGELMGHHLRKYHLTAYGSAVESMYRSEQMTDIETVRSLLSDDIVVDPLESFRIVAGRSAERSPAQPIVDAHFANYYSRMVCANNPILHTQTGLRVPFAHKEFLEHAARLPIDYRMKTLPFTRGKIPYGVTRLKLDHIRALNAGLETIPYERTGVAPSRPWPVHVAGFIAKTGTARLLSPEAYGGARLPDIWYREHAEFRRYFDEVLDAACNRSLFNDSMIEQLQQEHLSGDENHMTSILSAVTTLERWLQQQANRGSDVNTDI
jgi:asparagine synthase (glutamine-hydrolysing)